MKKKSLFLIIIVALLIFFGISYYLHSDLLYFFKPSISVNIEKLVVESDLDNDGINDLDDILEGARKEVENGTRYHSAYYDGGYPQMMKVSVPMYYGEH